MVCSACWSEGLSAAPGLAANFHTSFAAQAKAEQVQVGDINTAVNTATKDTKLDQVVDEIRRTRPGRNNFTGTAPTSVPINTQQACNFIKRPRHEGTCRQSRLHSRKPGPRILLCQLCMFPCDVFERVAKRCGVKQLREANGVVQRVLCSSALEQPDKVSGVHIFICVLQVTGHPASDAAPSLCPRPCAYRQSAPAGEMRPRAR